MTLCKTPVVTATRKSIMMNSEQVPSTGISSHEEADTIIVQTNKGNFFYTRHRLVGTNPS